MMHTRPTRTQRNRLADETSPYLLQHASNPVDWHAWGSEVLDLARREDKPILLSIGYSACHWCHVMAHESFEDPACAQVMNELFVNVKVDREERPDLDRIYQTAHQMLTQRGGGWPLTMFLSPHDQRPFFGGTYFPPEPRHGMPAFTDLLRRVAEYYRSHRAEIERAGRRADPGIRRAHASAGRGRRGARSRAARGRARAADTRVRRSIRRFRPGAQISAPDESRVPAAQLARVGRCRRWRGARSAGALHGHAHPDPHGRGRHLRPAGRWLLPVFGRPVLDDPAFREDAVRQRPAARGRGAGGARDRAIRSSCGWRARRRTGCGATWRAPAEVSSRRWMRIRKATKAASTPGTAKSCAACCRQTSMPRSRLASASTGRRISRASGICTASSP